MEKTIEQQNRKLKEYENEGELSKMIRKLKGYEKELNDMYGTVAEKEKGTWGINQAIQEYRVKNDVLEKVNGQLHDKLKELMFEKRALKKRSLLVMRDDTSPEDSRLFPTELKDRPTDKTHDESLAVLLPNRERQASSAAKDRELRTLEYRNEPDFKRLER